jgi:putative transposase
VFKHFSRWCRRGVWKALHLGCPHCPDLQSVFIDSTVMRAHACATGAVGSDAETEALGRSRGGFGTKTHAITDALGNLLDSPRPKGKPAHWTSSRASVLELTPEGADALVGNKSDDSDAFVQAVRERGVKAIIPPQGAMGMRLVRLQEASFGRVLLQQIKHYHRIFARYDKTARNWGILYFVSPSSGCGNVNRPKKRGKSPAAALITGRGTKAIYKKLSGKRKSSRVNGFERRSSLLGCPSDLKGEEWSRIEHHFQSQDRRGHASKHPRKQIVDAILYIVKTGAQGGCPPKDFPPRQTVYDHFRRWNQRGVWEAALGTRHRKKTSGSRPQLRNHRFAERQNPARQRRPGDRWRQTVKGRKRHIVVDILGNLLYVQVHAAHLHDIVGGCEVLRRATEKHPSLEAFSGDAGYRGTTVRFVEEQLTLALHSPKKSRRVSPCYPSAAG